MKKLFIIMLLGTTLYACGPSGSANNGNNGSVSPTVSSSPTADTAIKDAGTGAAKGTEAARDSTQNH